MSQRFGLITTLRGRKVGSRDGAAARNLVKTPAKSGWSSQRKITTADEAAVGLLLLEAVFLPKMQEVVMRFSSDLKPFSACVVSEGINRNTRIAEHKSHLDGAAGKILSSEGILFEGNGLGGDA